MTELTYAVSGMTCQHCVNAVTSELSELDDVTQVDVDLSTGSVTVTSHAPLEHAVVAEAIDEAGYQLTGTVR